MPTAPEKGVHISLYASGVDSTGPFGIVGVYHKRTNRIVLRMTYDTNAASRFNLGHTAYIRLKQRVLREGFQGYWYVNTDVFEDVDDMALN